MKFVSFAAMALTLVAGPVVAAAPVVAPVATAPADLKVLPMAIGGRVQQKNGAWTYQWPGTYFETAFQGQAVYFRVGPGDEILHVAVDGKASAPVVKPAIGLYGIEGLEKGVHTIRVEVVTESQAAPDTFGGFFASADGKPAMFGVRLKIENGKITEAEHLVGNTPAASAMANLQAVRPALLRDVPYEYADSRGRLIWLGKSYYAALDDGNSQESAWPKRHPE